MPLPAFPFIFYTFDRERKGVREKISLDAILMRSKAAPPRLPTAKMVMLTEFDQTSQKGKAQEEDVSRARSRVPRARSRVNI